MADLTITATSVIPGADAQITRGTAGATITAGMVVYKDTAASDVLKAADANASALTAVVAGIALNGGSTGQTILYQTAGLITIGATVAAGKPYVLSATAGLVAAGADLTTGWYASYLGYATTTAVINIQINNTGVIVA